MIYGSRFFGYPVYILYCKMFQKLKGFLFKNTSTRQTVVKNTFWLTVSNFGGRFLRAIIVIYAARMLGTSQWGVFSYAISLAGFMTLFMDPGVNAILTRNTANVPDEERKTVFVTSAVVKLFLALIGCFLIIVIAPLFSTLPGAKALLPIVAIILACDTFRDFFSALLRGQERMEWDAYIQVLMNLGILILGFVFLSFVPTAKSLAWGYAIGTFIGALIAAAVIRPYFKNARASFSSKLIKPLLSSAWPFAITGALGLLLTNTDILIVSWMRTASDVGIYSAAIRIIQVLYLVPTVIQFGTLPLFARLAKKDNPTFRKALEETVALIFLASIPLALGGAILGTQIMGFVFGPSYAAGGIAFSILMITMLVDFPAAVISNAIFAYDHQKSLIVCSAIGGITNVALDLLLIPKFGIVGSAVGTLIAQSASNWYLWHTMNRLNPFTVLSRVWRIAVAGVALGATCFLLAMAGVNLILTIAIAGVLYFLILRILREPVLREVKHVLMRAGA